MRPVWNTGQERRRFIRAASSQPGATGQRNSAIAGHAFMQNLQRGHYELGVLAAEGLTVAAAFDELARAL